jgi:hypothetical protein
MTGGILGRGISHFTVFPSFSLCLCSDWAAASAYLRIYHISGLDVAPRCHISEVWRLYQLEPRPSACVGDLQLRFIYIGLSCCAGSRKTLNAVVHKIPRDAIATLAGSPSSVDNPPYLGARRVGYRITYATQRWL